MSPPYRDLRAERNDPPAREAERDRDKALRTAEKRLRSLRRVVVTIVLEQGEIRTRDLTEAGVHRPMPGPMCDEGSLARLPYGVYAGAALAMPHADTAAMQLHLEGISLEEISRAVARGAHAVLLLDRAGWHTTVHLLVPKNLTLVLLLSWAPELNPVENI